MVIVTEERSADVVGFMTPRIGVLIPGVAKDVI